MKAQGEITLGIIPYRQLNAMDGSGEAGKVVPLPGNIGRGSGRR
jgi:hypothetical protein